MKIVTIIGARPQFVKAAMVSNALRKIDSICEVLVHTGQHFDTNMSEIFFTQMGIPVPDYNLNISSGNHGAMTGAMLIEIERVCIKEKPDCVLVYGDTNSTLAAALAASKLHIPVVHIEAGLRSFNMKMPEEINRILTDRISSLLCCPTDTAMKNLEEEGYLHFDCDIVKTGDVMQDAALHFAKMAVPPKGLDSSVLESDFILATLHRAENVDDEAIFKSCIEILNSSHIELPVVFPVHPRTRNAIKKFDLKLDVHMIEPVGYLEMLFLLDKCSAVITDSGGLQKEAYFFNKSCLTLRNETEWLELVEAGCVRLVGQDLELAMRSLAEVLEQKKDFDPDLYGGGNASDLIANKLANYVFGPLKPD